MLCLQKNKTYIQLLWLFTEPLCCLQAEQYGLWAACKMQKEWL